MALLSESEARTILNKVLALSKADECQVTLSGGRAGNLRFARNTVSTAGGSDTLSLSISSSLGAKTGSVTVNELDDASLAKAVRAAEELIAREQVEKGLFPPEFAGAPDDPVRVLSGPDIVHIVVCGDPHRNRVMVLWGGYVNPVTRKMEYPTR